VSANRPAHRVASRLVLAALSVAFFAPPEAGAERGITAGIAAPEYQSLDGGSRDLWFNRTVEGNAELVRIDVVWNRVVGSQRPADPRDPADPAYDFSRLDAAVRAAEQRGLKVHFTVYSAPDWASGPNRPAGFRPSAWRPDPGEYGNFGSALAKRYSGSFSPAAGVSPLPRVSSFEAWNEPNLDGFLAPQWAGDHVEGPAVYRPLLNSFYDAVTAVDPGITVVSGGTGSFGEDPPSQTRTRPVRFLRELFCLEGRKKLEPRPCPKVKMDVLGHHPISGANPATYNAINPDDAATSDVGRLERVLRAAEKADVVRPGGRRPIWATEFWWVSKPPKPSGEFAKALAVPVRQQARYIEQALYVLWKQRVRVAIQYLIRDQGGSDPFQTGLFFSDGDQKPSFQAFRFPFVTDRLSRKRVLAWGRSPEAGKVKIQGRKRGGWRTLKSFRVQEDEVFTARLRRNKQMRARIGATKSLVW
jgi:hypothetical protein